MTRYNYAREVSPPAPFVFVSFSSVDGSKSSAELLAQVDTGASRTVLPAEVVDALGLVPIAELAAEGLGGVVTLLPTYVVRLAMRGMTAVEVEAVAAPHEPYVLLGRDVLNHYHIFLDGPGLALEVRVP